MVEQDLLVDGKAGLGTINLFCIMVAVVVLVKVSLEKYMFG